MTAAGVTALVTTQGMIQAADQEKRPADANAPRQPSVKKPIDDACSWLGSNFSIMHNPGDGHWMLYYLGSLAKAGRLSERQMLVNNRGQGHDWYAEGARYLVETQNPIDGTWQDDGGPVIGTCFALQFLISGAKGK